MRTHCRSGLSPLVRLLAVLVLPAAAAPGPLTAQERVRPEAVGMSTERLDRLGEALQTYVRDGRLPGGVVLVARDGKVVYEEAFGDRDVEADDPMETDDLFRIASQTKALVSVATMVLQEEGKLLLSDPVGRWLPEFSETRVAVPSGDGDGYDVVEAERRITIRDLLTHSAGVGYGYGVPAEEWVAAGIQGWYFADRDEPIRATVERMAALPFEAQPGEEMVYGYSTDILGAVLEVVAGESLDELLRSRILEPLGMEDTHFFLPPSKRDRLSVVYSLEDGALTRAPDPGGMVGQGAYVDGPRTSFSGGAGLLSTARDYARFLLALWNGGELDGVRILSPKSVQLMTVNHVGDLMARFSPGMGFGLGFQVVEDVGARGVPSSVGEYGWGGAYHSTYWVDPVEELVVVYLTQVIPAGGLDDQARMRALVYQAIVESRGGR